MANLAEATNFYYFNTINKMEKEKMPPPIVSGQTLYYEIENLRGQTTGEIGEYTVADIGRIYFTVKENSQRRFNKNTLRHSNARLSQLNMQLYRTKEEILEIYEHTDLYLKIYKLFRWFNDKNKFTLQQLRDIAKICGI